MRDAPFCPSCRSVRVATNAEAVPHPVPHPVVETTWTLVMPLERPLTKYSGMRMSLVVALFLIPMPRCDVWMRKSRVALLLIPMPRCDVWMAAVEETVRSQCELSAPDILRCRREGIEEVSEVKFSCTGYTGNHVSATVELVDNRAYNCNKYISSTQYSVTVGGSAFAYTNLARYCGNQLDFEQSCDLGQADTATSEQPICQTSDECRATLVCTPIPGVPCTGSRSCAADFDPLLPDSNDVACSIAASSGTPPKEDLARTLFSSRHDILMLVLGQAEEDCSFYEPVPFTIECGPGGVLGPISDPEGVCTKNNDNSFQCILSGLPLIADGTNAGYAVIFTCLGETESALVATASTPARVASGCQADATVFHGFTMRRQCEDVSNNFVREWYNGPSFCAEDETYTTVSGTRYCRASTDCNSIGSCTMEPLQASTYFADSHGCQLLEKEEDMAAINGRTMGPEEYGMLGLDSASFQDSTRNINGGEEKQKVVSYP